MKELLEKLAYCNKAIKLFPLILSKSKFYEMKKVILRNVIENRDAYKIIVAPQSIELENYERLLIALHFITEDFRVLEFHQPYVPNFYKKLDIIGIPFKPFKAVAIKDEEYSIELANKYIEDLITFYKGLVPKSTILAEYIQMAKERFPNFTFKRQKTRISITLPFEDKIRPVKMPVSKFIKKMKQESLMDYLVNRLNKQR